MRLWVMLCIPGFYQSIQSIIPGLSAIQIQQLNQNRLELDTGLWQFKFRKTES